MSSIPWDAPAVADVYVMSLNLFRADLTDATLREAVIYVMSQTDGRGEGYIVRLVDESQSWEGPEIAELAADLPQ